MRWMQPKPPKHGNIRFIKRFLWLPLTIQRETRWLEFVKIRQRYNDGVAGGRGYYGKHEPLFPGPRPAARWENLNFVAKIR